MGQWIDHTCLISSKRHLLTGPCRQQDERHLCLTFHMWPLVFRSLFLKSALYDAFWWYTAGPLQSATFFNFLWLLCCVQIVIRIRRRKSYDAVNDRSCDFSLKQISVGLFILLWAPDFINFCYHVTLCGQILAIICHNSYHKISIYVKELSTISLCWFASPAYFRSTTIIRISFRKCQWQDNEVLSFDNSKSQGKR